MNLFGHSMIKRIKQCIKTSQLVITHVQQNYTNIEIKLCVGSYLHITGVGHRSESVHTGLDCATLQMI